MSILVLGIGNLIMSDDGIGVRVIQHLQDHYRFPSDVIILEGGTLGLDLLPRLDGIDRLVIVDATETGGPPGTLVRLSGDELSMALKTKVSPHQMGLQDLLAVADLLGQCPGEIVLCGVQPASIAIGEFLSPPVAAQLAALADMVIRELAEWGIKIKTEP